MTLGNFIYRCAYVSPMDMLRWPYPMQHSTELRIIHDHHAVYEGTLWNLLLNCKDTYKTYMCHKVMSWYVPNDVDIDESKIVDERWMPVLSILVIVIGESELPNPLSSDIRKTISICNGVSRITLKEILDIAAMKDQTRVTIVGSEHENRFEGTVNELEDMMKMDDAISEFDIVYSMWVPRSYIPVMRNSDLYDPTKNYSATLSIQVTM